MFSYALSSLDNISKHYKEWFPWIWSSSLVRRNIRPTIVNIPLEVVLEIMSRLELLDILRMRRTCKFLQAATTAKSLWTNLFWECERTSFGTLSLEKPIEMHASDELERVVLSWKSTQVGWRTNDGVPSRQRTIFMDREWLNSLASPLEAFRDLYLVPGGRWLLGFRPDGEVFYYDLESPNYEEKRLLVAAYIKDAWNNNVEISVDIPERLPIRSFKVAQYIDEHGPAGSTKYKGIKIWEVNFVFEGKRVAGLKATCLKTIPVDPACDTSMVSVSLCNEHLAIAVQYSYPILGDVMRQRLQYIYILEWLHIVDGSLDYSRRVLYVDEAQEITEIHLLTNNRIFALSSPWACVYDFSALQHTDRTPQRHPDHSTLTPPSVCELSSFAWTMQASIPYVSPHCVHILSTVSSKKLHAITIPDNLGGTGSSSHLVVKPLIPLPPYEIQKEWPAPYNLGIRHGILYRKDHASTALILLEYDPHQEFTPDYVPVIKTIPCPQIDIGTPGVKRLVRSIPIRNLLLDEGSGRVVVPLCGQFEVLDFALFHKSRSVSSA